jgi:flotillin
LTVKEAEYQRLVQLAQVETAVASQLKEIEMGRVIQVERAQLETEKIRADKLAQAKVNYETTIQNANSAYYEMQKKAEGAQLLYEAQAEGINNIVSAFKMDSRAALKYMMIQKGYFLDLAKLNSEAVKGLQPKICVWNTGSSGGSGSSNSVDMSTYSAALSNPILKQTLLNAMQTKTTAPS